MSGLDYFDPFNHFVSTPWSGRAVFLELMELYRPPKFFLSPLGPPDSRFIFILNLIIALQSLALWSFFYAVFLFEDFKHPPFFALSPSFPLQALLHSSFL